MPQEIPETFRPEAFRLYAREILKLDLADDERESLRDAVNGLIAELAPLEAVDLDGVEPDVRFALEPGGWPR